MNPRYLLDTNILSDLVRNPQGRIRDSIVRFGESAVCTSIIVTAELRFGASKRNSAILSRQIELILSALEVMPFEEPADRVYGEIRAALEAQGISMGPNDMLIAAHATTLDCTVVTANEREFSRIPGLLVENWLRP